jgi:hypothetical protein
MRSPIDPLQYRWSSHGAYVGKTGDVKIETAVVLGELARSVGPARRAYLRFMAEGKAMGHQTDYYQVWDQRILGDERFVERIDERIRAEREIEVPGPKATFANLLHWTAEHFGVKEKQLVAVGRQRQCVRARSMLVYLAREWARVSVKEIARRLHRDPSIISRLYFAYAADRDQKNEKLLAKRLQK